MARRHLLTAKVACGILRIRPGTLDYVQEQLPYLYVTGPTNRRFPEEYLEAYMASMDRELPERRASADMAGDFARTPQAQSLIRQIQQQWDRTLPTPTITGHQLQKLLVVDSGAVRQWMKRGLLTFSATQLTFPTESVRKMLHWHVP